MHADSWALKAKNLGLRSRAVFKLEEILTKTKILKKNSLVLDIGSAPGGWSELIKAMSPSSSVYAIDLLPMDPIQDVEFFQEDIANIDQIEEIFSLKSKFDLVISDLAPNLTGISSVDQAAMEDLVLAAVRFALEHLGPKGVFIGKFFEGERADALRHKVEKAFSVVRVRKPGASRAKSAEAYLVARQPIGGEEVCVS